MKQRKFGIFLSYVNTGLNMVCGLFLSSYLLRSLGETEYGIYQTVASFANYLVLLQFGTGTVMTRNIAMCHAKNAPEEEVTRNVTTIWTLTCILGVVILIMAGLFYAGIDTLYANTLSQTQIAGAKEIFLFVTGYLVCAFLLQTVNGVTLAHEQYWFSSAQAIVRTAVRTVLLTVLILRLPSAVVIAKVDAALSGVLLLCSVLFVRFRCGIRLRIGRMNSQILLTAAPLCLALFLQTIINQANNNVDKFLIGIMLSPQAVSRYSVAMYIYSIFSSMTTIPISMYAPAVSKSIQKGVPMEVLEQELAAPCRLTAFVGGMVFFGFLAAGRPFLTLVYGEEYLVAWPIALLVMMPMYINMINGVLINVLDALNKRMVRSFVLMITTLANILLTIAWIPSLGIVGASLATAICTLLGQVFLMNLYYYKKIKINIFRLFREACGHMLGYMILGAGCALAAGRFLEHAVLELAVCIGVFLAVFLLLSVLNRRKIPGWGKGKL